MFSEDFLRAEVWHALSVHFPIALLPTATLTLLISFFVRGTARRQWQIAATLLLFAGSLTAWLAIYTGNIADPVAARKICDPTVLKDHEIAGQSMTYLFTAAATLLAPFFTNTFMPRWKNLAFYLAFMLMVTGTGYLVFAGHAGASLVYEQGAGVNNHVVDCE